MSTPRILVVENEAIIAKHIENDLTQAGYATLGIALSGDEAIQRCQALHPNLILMDIMMEPGPDGIETAARIHAFMDVPIIYITAHNDEEHLLRARQTELYGYLIKPVDFNTLHSAVEVALHKHAVHKKLKQQLRRLTATRAIDQSILSHQTLQPVLAICLEQITSSLNVDAARILISSAQYHLLENKAAIGLQNNDPIPYTRLAIEQEKRVFIQDIQNDSLIPTWLKDAGFVSYLGVPLTSNGKTNGVLEIFHHTELDPDLEWFETLDALAGQVDVAQEHFAVLEKLRNANEALIQSYDATIQGWSHALELRDQETEGHSQRVTTLTMKLAAAMHYPEPKMVDLRRGALLHDIGKMGIPDGSLLKPGPLTPEDWVVMRKHPQYAYDLLKGVPFLQDALEIPYCHHERWDGSGYPRGLAGDEIPLAARIFAVVDVWDALRSERLYRESWPAEKVLAYICEQSGSHFDPQVVDAFVELYEAENF